MKQRKVDVPAALSYPSIAGPTDTVTGATAFCHVVVSNVFAEERIMFLEKGDVLLVSHRRQFNHEETRYFLGTVVEYENGLAKVDGYTFVRDLNDGRIIRKNERRTKIISLMSGNAIVYELPEDTDVESATFEFHEGDLTFMDGKALHMNMSEMAHAGHI